MHSVAYMNASFHSVSLLCFSSFDLLIELYKQMLQVFIQMHVIIDTEFNIAAHRLFFVVARLFRPQASSVPGISAKELH